MATRVRSTGATTYEWTCDNCGVVEVVQPEEVNDANDRWGVVEARTNRPFRTKWMLLCPTCKGAIPAWVFE